MIIDIFNEDKMMEKFSKLPVKSLTCISLCPQLKDFFYGNSIRPDCSLCSEQDCEFRNPSPAA